MGHYDSCREGYCACGAAPGNLASNGGVCPFCNRTPYKRNPDTMYTSMTTTKRTTARMKPATKKPENHRHRWTPDQDLALVTAFCRGMSASDLAKDQRRTKYAVIGRLHTLGLLSFDKDTMTYYTKPQHYYRVKPKTPR